MGYRKKGLVALFLACSPLLAQINPDGQVRQAFVLEQQGQFGQVIAITRPLIESTQLSGVELARACITLAVAYEGGGQFAEAREAFERSLHTASISTRISIPVRWMGSFLAFFFSQS
jgi:hypothetical protein